MKKIFTLISMAFLAMSVNAQEAWFVINEDGTLKADYVANEDPNAMSVVTFSTENVTGTHTSGPVSEKFTEPTDENANLDEEFKPIYNNSWTKQPGEEAQKKDLSKDGSVPPFYYVCGQGNPVDISLVKPQKSFRDDKFDKYTANWDDAYYQPDGSKGLPTNGTYITLTPKVAGSMMVGVWINKGSRDIYVAKKSDAKALALGTEVTASGYINGTNWPDTQEGDPLHGYPMFQENIAPKGTEGSDAYVVGAGNQPAWVYLTFDVVAEETYYIFNKNTQIGFYGFQFTPGSADGISEITTANNNAPVYNLAGQRVSNDTKGLLIKNGKKFINK